MIFLFFVIMNTFVIVDRRESLNCLNESVREAEICIIQLF